MATEAPNTLRSRAKFHVIDIISEGPCVGLADGLKSIYLDETPIESSTGVLNFKNFKATTDLTLLPRAYLPDQTESILSGASTSRATESVNVKVTKDSPEGSGSGDGSVSRTITDADLDAIRVNMRLPALNYQDLSTGNYLGTNVDFKISVASNGGSAVPIQGAREFNSWALEQEETPDGATGVWVVVEAFNPSFPLDAAKYISLEYSRKTGGAWGSWVQFGLVSIPAPSPSSNQRSYWDSNNWSPGTFKDFNAVASNLAPGIYKVRVVATNCTVAIKSKRYEGEKYLTISGKCVAPYDASFLVPLPAGGAPWTVTVSRVTDDRIASNYNDDIYWLSYDEVLYEKFSWPYLDGAELTLDAEDFDSIPERAYDWFGLIVNVPSNYDSYARTYSGIWDGTFKEAWTDNPAWILYDLVCKKRYGLGDDIPESYLDTLKWSLYSIAQYCDEPITVQGDITEPRYTCSVCINTQQEAYDLLNQIVSSFRGMLYPAGEGLIAVADRLTDPVINVGPANVIGGIFTYQGPARKTIHTAAYVSYNNPDDAYRLNTVLYENREGIRQYGYRTDKINAIGACSKSLAIRLAKWKVLTEVMAPDTVTYRASFDHLNVMPGDIINISDPAYTSEELIGRIKSITEDTENSTHVFELDRSVVRIGGDESLLQITLPDQTVLSLDVSVSVTTTGTEIVVPSSQITAMPNVGTIWLLSKETVRPRMWRVFNIEESEPNVYEVTASLIDPNKWAEIEGGFNFEPADYTGFPSGEMPAPIGVDYSEFLNQSGNSVICCVNLSWTRPDDARCSFFRAEYRKENEPWKSTEPVLCQTPSIDILNIDPGVYDFRVQAQDSTGLVKSDWTYAVSKTLLGKKKAPENVTNLTATVEKFGILLKWTPITDIDVDYYEVRQGVSWAAGEASAKKVKASELKIEDATTGSYTFWVAAKDTSLNYSATPTSVNVTVSAQTAPSVSAVAINGGIQLTISGDVQRGFKAYEIQRRLSPSGSPSTINSNVLTRIFTDSDIATLGYDSEWQYRARALDQNESASAWSDYTVAKTPKQVETADLTNQPIIGKYFATASNVGCSQDGVLFNSSGIQAWYGGIKTVDIPVTGNPVFSGTITANAGCIGGWSIGNCYLLHNCIDGVLNRALVLSPLEKSMYFYMGNVDSGAFLGQTHGPSGFTGRYGLNAKSNGTIIFEASHDTSGVLTAQIAGWNFNCQCLYANNLIINSLGSIQTANFVTGNNGWKIDCIGNAEFNNLCARGAIRTAVFVKDEISVVGGMTMIRPAGVATLGCNPSADCVNIYLGESASQFAINDIVRMKSGTSDYWGYVAGGSCDAYGCFIYVCKKSGTRFEFTAGQAVVNYGSCLGSGGIMLNGQAPYIDLYTHDGSPWNGTNSRMRMGSLEGWGSGFTTGDYGWVAGCPTGQRAFYTPRTGLKVYGDIEAVGAGNLLPDPDFRGVPYNADMTTFGNGTVVGEYVTGICGSAGAYGAHRQSDWRYMYLRPDSNGIWLFSGGAGSYSTFCSKSFISVQAGSTYTLSGYVAKHIGYCNPTVYLGLLYYDANMNHVCESYPALNNCYLDCLGAVTRFSGSTTIGAGISYVKVVAYNINPPGAAYAYFSGIQLEQGSVATSWKNNQGGTITANCVKSGALTSLNWNGTTTGSCINMDSGVFNFGGGKLTWDGSTLVTNGTICSGCGNIGGWGICSGWLQSPFSNGDIVISSMCRSFYLYRGSSNIGEFHGQIYHNGEWTGRYGFAVTRGAGSYLFRVDTDGSGLNGCAQIAGWDFNCSSIYKSTSVHNCAQHGYPGLAINAYNDNVNATGLGFRYVAASNSYPTGDFGVSIGEYLLQPGVSWYNRKGIMISSATNGIIFRADTDMCGNNMVATIAGWYFNASCLTSTGYGLVLNSCGSITGNYTAGCCGWAIFADGSAEFNNVTVRGAVYATSGKIGAFSLGACGDMTVLSASPTATYINLMTCDFAYSACVMPSAIALLSAYNTAIYGNNNTTLCYINGSLCHTYISIATGSCSYTRSSGSGYCSCLMFSSLNNGQASTVATMQIYMYGGSDCFALCTNGRIQVQGTVYPSDRNLKTDFQDVSVLESLRQMPITMWRFKQSKDYQIGPVAQDFNRIFKLNHDWQTNLTVGGLDGIALKAIKEVDENVQAQEKEISSLRKKIAHIEASLAELKESVAIH